MSEVCKITRTIQNRFDMGGTYRILTRCVDGEKETIIMDAAEVICCFLEEKIYTTDQQLVHTSTHTYLRYDYYDLYNRLQFVHTHCS